MNRDIRLGIALMAIFILLFAYSFTFQKSDVMTTHTTAAFFPRVVLIVAMILTLLMIISNLAKGEGGKDETTSTLDKPVIKRLLGSMGFAVFLGFGVSYIGTLVTISLFIIGVMVTWGVQNKVTILLNAVLTPVLIYLVFTMLLEVQLPMGFLI